MKRKSNVAPRKAAKSKSRAASAAKSVRPQSLTTFLTKLPTKEPSLSTDQMKLFAMYASSSSEE